VEPRKNTLKIIENMFPGPPEQVTGMQLQSSSCTCGSNNIPHWIYPSSLFHLRGHVVVQSVKAAKVAVSISDGVTGIFH
jgi:hypothetical protein